MNKCAHFECPNEGLYEAHVVSRDWSGPVKVCDEHLKALHGEESVSMSVRPEWITCIAHVMADRASESLCGRKSIKEEFHFVDVSHAVANGMNEGRLVACPECVDVAIAALRHGYEPTRQLERAPSEAPTKIHCTRHPNAKQPDAGWDGLEDLKARGACCPAYARALRDWNLSESELAEALDHVKPIKDEP